MVAAVRMAPCRSAAEAALVLTLIKLDSFKETSQIPHTKLSSSACLLPDVHRRAACVPTGSNLHSIELHIVLKYNVIE